MVRVRKNIHVVQFNDQLILFQYFLSLFGKNTLFALAGQLNSIEYEGYDENQNTNFYKYLDNICSINAATSKINRDKLRTYDENICRHVRSIGEKRGGIVLKYFQYISLLFTEIYLDRYFHDKSVFVDDLNAFVQEEYNKSLGEIAFTPFTPESLNKIAFMSATGSGKTLIMHINIMQFMYYLNHAPKQNNRFGINRIIVLSPNEGMSKQHLEELKLSSIPASIFDKDLAFFIPKNEVIIIDINKFKEEGKVKTVSIDSFEQNNLVLVDEAHRGLTGDVWYDYRSRLSAEGGFAFEYSATFKQALKSLNPNKASERPLFEEYCKSIIMDYSYKYFYEDGYGKEYRIYNLRDSIDEEERYLYLTGCLLSFYQQVKLYGVYDKEYAPFEIQKPLLVFVGNRVTATTSAAELTDVEEVLDFIDKFVSNKAVTISRIQAVLEGDTGLMDASGHELFFQVFKALEDQFGGHADPEAVYNNVLRLVFNTETTADAPRLHLENLKQVNGEIALKIGEDGAHFGVISIGDTAGLIKNCDKKGIVAKDEEFASESLFLNINDKESDIKVLIGSRKFTEGWNSWRVSTMGLINFAKGEGSQAIQLFGRGVRLRGYHGCLKRSNKLDDTTIRVPKYIEILETLTIFGIKAQYMEDFKKYLELEDMPTNDNVHEFTLPVLSRYDEVKDKKLRIIRVKGDANFKKQAARLLLDVPDEGFERYLIKNKIIIDCRSKVQTIESTGSILRLDSVTEEHTVDAIYLPYLNYDRMFEELELYKNEKFYYNISIDKKKLLNIMAVDGWYALIIPEIHLRIDSIEKLAAATDYCILALKRYMDKFYKYHKEQWEAPRLEYREITAEDDNFVSEYTLSYADANDQDKTADDIKQFVDDVTALLENDGGIVSYEKSTLSNSLLAFDFRYHLYAPLICVKQNNLKLQVTPVSLNESEKLFVDQLKDFIEKHTSVFDGKSLYLLRNKSKVGMGFFEAGNFYPDYVLWIDTPEVQYVSFIDPKGLIHVMPNDPKVEFYKTIKELEARLQPTCKDKKIILNSFIMSGTKAADLKQWWHMSKQEREAKNVLCLDNEDCMEVMMRKVLGVQY